MNDRELIGGDIKPEDLTWREQDILILLAERLTNREIATRLHLAESTVKDYVGKILSKLYVKNRRQAVERAKSLGLLEGDRKIAASVRTKLPTEPTPFIGRKDELEEIRKQLEKTRLLTLTGPGGMGKTRLALKAGEEATGDFEHGSFFVSLSPIRSAGDIIQTVAEAVNFPIASHEHPQVQLIRYLKKRELLLVMDNFEHLLEGVPIVSEILKAAPAVKILATSREKLKLQSETNLSIGGMGTPDEEMREDIEKYDAITLFLQSAKKVRPSFDPSPEELGEIRKICQIVQGMPLAIELAAAWVQILTVGEIVRELEKGIDILSSEVRDAPERHRSISAVFDHSWFLLDPIEQEIFKLISVFRGGFTREAAQEVSGASLQQLVGLVNKSFLSHDPNSGRMEVHELLRQYAQARLEETPEASEAAQEKHAAYFGEFMQEKWQHLKDNRQLQALTEIEADIENARAAWRYYVDQKNTGKMRMFINSIWLVYVIRGWYHAGMELFGNAVKALSDMQDDVEVIGLHALAMANQGFFMGWLGLADQGYPLAKESVEILERLDDATDLVIACNSLSLNTYYLNLPNEEKEAAQKVLATARESNDKWELGIALYLASQAAFRVGDYQESKELAEASLRIGEESGEVVASAWSLTALGQIAFLHKEYAEAKGYYLRCLKESKELGYRWAIGNSIKYLGQVALLEDDIPEAEKYFIQSLQIAHELGLDRDIANHLYEFARLRVAQDRTSEAAELLALSLRQPASRQARLGGGSIRDIVKGLLAEVEGEVSAERYVAAMERGQDLVLDEVIDDLIGVKS